LFNTKKLSSLLEEENNFLNRIHNESEKKKIAIYHCTRRMSATVLL
jgi:hypothetical protein